MNDRVTPEKIANGIGTPSTIDFNLFKLIVDRDVCEVVALESINDFELAGVVLDSLDRFGSRFPEFTAQYAGEIAKLRSDTAA